MLLGEHPAETKEQWVNPTGWKKKSDGQHHRGIWTDQKMWVTFLVCAWIGNREVCSLLTFFFTLMAVLFSIPANSSRKLVPRSNHSAPPTQTRLSALGRRGCCLPLRSLAPRLWNKPYSTSGDWPLPHFLLKSARFFAPSLALPEIPFRSSELLVSCWSSRYSTHSAVGEFFHFEPRPKNETYVSNQWGNQE